ncbi:class I SAM-dependent methyltransferase [Variovorax boronicumulans]|uniref:class I SAM-dependent methyltransferase n=1 Tax=Variovorax boronicumulans TaxID=436515 RepID=UPI00278AC83F|nr:class I SAM-dependent methyltransferase [Variovorax boronicumulans]MDQ0041822.1 SAM-dependent methyltransferase [Variovorax boronicumulans]
MTDHAMTRCLCCDAARLRPVLDLGNQPPANSYTRTAAEQVPPFPLGLNLCTQCWHAQLTYCVDRRNIFDRYAYVSGTSATLNRFFAWFAQSLARVVPAGGRVLEIAANDGSLIREMQAAGLDCIGVDPAANIVDAAQKAGLPITCAYWPEASAQLTGTFDAIVCMNVVAHVDAPFEFLQECALKLSPGGVVLVQPSQARMFENGEFDTIYHEHLSFFNTRSMSRLAARAGLKLVDAFMVKIHGDSPVYVLQHANEASAPPSVRGAFSTGDFAIDEGLAAYEERVNLYQWDIYERFATRATQTLKDVAEAVRQHEVRGFEIVFVGAAAKAMTLINAAGIRPTRFLDENPLKIGLHAPGCGTLIEPLETCRRLDKPALFVLSAWNFRHELAQKLEALGVPEGSSFYAYFPKAGIL